MSAIRIKNIQETIGATADGFFGKMTAIAVLNYIGAVPQGSTLQDYIKQIQKAMGLSGRDADGVLGPQTLTKLEDFLSSRLVTLPAGAYLIISNATLSKIIEFEISSTAQYNNKYKNPVWPGGASGITIGIGYDLGYVTAAEFKNVWKNYISENVVQSLTKVVGLKGDAAKNKLHLVKTEIIPYEAARDVFYLNTLSKYAKQVRNIYPKAHLLPPDAQGALLSLVFNRGSSLSGDTRREMKNIQAYVESQNLQKIADEIRAMKRLWPNVNGLLKRREAEAALVENASFRILKDDQIAV